MIDNNLGDFLRARRSALLPEDVGMVTYGVRRVKGLRREEVAVLAGVNADYYTRLEQGRERHPSPQVLDALSRALCLDADARSYLYRLTGAVPDDRYDPSRNTVGPALRRLMDGYPHTPALVINRTLDVLAVNALAGALYSAFDPVDNLARMVFLAPAGRSFHTRWNWTAQATVANLRQAVGFAVEGSRLGELVDELTGRSGEFADLWNAQDVRGKTRDAKHFDHPDVGPLTLTYQAFDVREAPGQQLVVYHAEPGSRSAEALSLLGTVNATRRQAARHPHP